MATSAIRLARPAPGQIDRGRATVSPEGSVRTTVDGRGCPLSNLDKVLYPETGFTKGQVIDYYARVAAVMLPHLRDRPVTLQALPQRGRRTSPSSRSTCPGHAPEWVPTGAVPVRPRRSAGSSTPSSGTFPVWYGPPTWPRIELHVPLWTSDRGACCPLGLTTSSSTSTRARGPDRRVLRGGPLRWADALEDSWRRVPAQDAVARRASSSTCPSPRPPDLGEPGTATPTGWPRSSSGPPRPGRDQHAQGAPAEQGADRLEPESPTKTTVAAYSLRGRPEPTVSTPVTWERSTGAHDPATRPASCSPPRRCWSGSRPTATSSPRCRAGPLVTAGAPPLSCAAVFRGCAPSVRPPQQRSQR